MREFDREHFQFCLEAGRAIARDNSLDRALVLAGPERSRQDLAATSFGDRFDASGKGPDHCARSFFGADGAGDLAIGGGT